MKRAAIFLAALFAVLSAASFSPATDADGKKSHRPRTGIYLELTEDFYRALQESPGERTRTLSTQMSEEYLQQIAVATRYTVETNLQILHQQERIIKLLEEIRDNKN